MKTGFVKVDDILGEFNKGELLVINFPKGSNYVMESAKTSFLYEMAKIIDEKNKAHLERESLLIVFNEGGFRDLSFSALPRYMSCYEDQVERIKRMSGICKMLENLPIQTVYRREKKELINKDVLKSVDNLCNEIKLIYSNFDDKESFWDMLEPNNCTLLVDWQNCTLLDVEILKKAAVKLNIPVVLFYDGDFMECKNKELADKVVVLTDDGKHPKRIEFNIYKNHGAKPETVYYSYKAKTFLTKSYPLLYLDAYEGSGLF